MFLKTLVTGVAAAAVVAAAAGGVTSLATTASPAITPVVWDIPMPQAPAPELQTPLTQTLNGLAGPGSFAAKSTYIQGGLGRFETRVADRKYADAAAKGYFPATFVVADIDQNGPVVTSNVTVTFATGASATQPVVFVAGPSPTGYQVTKDSALAVLSAVS